MREEERGSEFATNRHNCPNCSTVTITPKARHIVEKTIPNIESVGIEIMEKHYISKSKNKER